MYLARMFNEVKLFQHMGGWKNKYKGSSNNLLNQFFFRANSAYLNLRRMDLLSRDCVSQYHKVSKSLELKDNKILFYSPTVIELVGEFSPFLSTLRVLQNTIWRLTANECGISTSVPKSLNKAMKKGLDSYGLDENLCGIFTKYWNEGGKQIKDYRDIDQHYYSIAEHSYVQVYPKVKLLILLPDNPETTSKKTITFTKQIDSIDYFNASFYRFHNFAEEVALTLGFESEVIGESYGGPWMPPEEGEKKSVGLFVVNERTCQSLVMDIRRENGRVLLDLRWCSPEKLSPS